MWFNLSAAQGDQDAALTLDTFCLRRLPFAIAVLEVPMPPARRIPPP